MPVGISIADGVDPVALLAEPPFSKGCPIAGNQSATPFPDIILNSAVVRATCQKADKKAQSKQCEDKKNGGNSIHGK